MRRIQWFRLAAIASVGIAGAWSLLTTPTPAWAQDEKTASVCFIADFLGFRGTPGQDRWWGLPVTDVAQAGAGPDRLHGLGGDDRICGETGDDQIWGGDGNDRLYGQEGNDEISGQLGNDHISGGTGDDRLLGRSFAPKYLLGGKRDNIYGGPGHDRIQSDWNAGHLSGGPGNDIIEVTPHSLQRVYCGTGFDIVWGYNDPSHVTGVGCEQLQVAEPPGW